MGKIDRYFFFELLDDLRFEGFNVVVFIEVCVGGGLLNKKLLISF